MIFALRFVLFSILGLLATTMLAAFMGVAYLISDVDQVVEVSNSKVVTAEPRACGRLVIRQDYHNIRPCGASVDRWLFDSFGGRRQLQDIHYEKPPRMGHNVIEFGEDIPCEFKPGPATYEATPTYWCNQLQKIIAPFERRGAPTTVLPFTIYPPLAAEK